MDQSCERKVERLSKRMQHCIPFQRNLVKHSLSLCDQNLCDIEQQWRNENHSTMFNFEQVCIWFSQLSTQSSFRLQWSSGIASEASNEDELKGSIYNSDSSGEFSTNLTCQNENDSFSMKVDQLRESDFRPVRTSVSIAIKSRSDLVQSCPHLYVFLRRWIYVDRIAIQVIHLW